jgi:hypothetical protein
MVWRKKYFPKAAPAYRVDGIVSVASLSTPAGA